VQRASDVVAIGHLVLGLEVHPAPATDNALDMFSGADPADREQCFFGLGRCHTGQLTNLGIGQFAAGKRLRKQRQRAQGTCNPHALPSRARSVPHAPAQPRGARAEARVPSAARVELTDEIEQPRGRRFEMRRELGNLFTEAIDRRVVNAIGRASVHDESPFGKLTVHPGFGGTRKAAQSTIAAVSEIFRETALFSAHPRFQGFGDGYSDCARTMS
jgi:hypothetical protein